MVLRGTTSNILYEYSGVCNGYIGDDMSEYNPDKWLLVKITNTNTNESHYRVFASWYGGYLSSDSWQMNSGITKVTENNDYYFFEGTSGSLYSCRKGCYGASGYGSNVLSGLIEKSAKEGILMAALNETIDPMSLLVVPEQQAS